MSPGARGDQGNVAQAGQGIVEYGLILAIMIVVCAVALVFFGDQLAAILGFIISRT